MTRVAIQGEVGAYSHAAALQLLQDESIEVVENDSFGGAYGAVAEGRADLAVVPVENSLAGAVTRSLDLLPDCGLFAVAETHVRVELTLVGRPGSRVEALRTVGSHPVALEQCRNFLAAHPGLATRIAHDTAGSIRALMDGSAEYDGAIGPELAAGVHGAEVLARNVEDDPRNYTRFLELRTAPVPEGLRATVSVVAANRPGGLLELLQPLADEAVDMTHLVTRPVPGSPWHYRFHIELRADGGAQLNRALAALERAAEGFRLVGRYDLV